MAKEIEQVLEFHKVFEHPIGDVAKALSIKRGLQRHSYMKEELQEFHDAVEAEDDEDALPETTADEAEAADEAVPVACSISFRISS